MQNSHMHEYGGICAYEQASIICTLASVCSSQLEIFDGINMTEWHIKDLVHSKAKFESMNGNGQHAWKLHYF